MKKILLLFVFLLMVGSVFADKIGSHATEGVNNPDKNIDVRNAEFFERIGFFFQDTFAIATQNVQGQYVGTFKPGEIVNFHTDVTSYNTACGRTYVIAEVYDASNRFKQASSKYVGSLGGSGTTSNVYFVADIPYIISSSESSYGTWNAAGYLWCADTAGVTVQQVISKSYSTSFFVQDSSITTYTPGFIGDKTCRSGLSSTSGNFEDVYQQYRNADGSTEYKRVLQCLSSEKCLAGECIGLTTPEPSPIPNPNPTPSPNPSPLPNMGGYDYTWWLVGLVAIIILAFTGMGKKLLGMLGVRLR